MREIIFSGKRVDNGEKIESDSIQQLYGGSKVYLWYQGEWIEVVYKTVCEYTGLTDKNGKKIFEGDIVKWSHTFLGEDRPYHIGRVAYKKAQFVVENRDVFAHCGTCSEPFGCACRMDDANRDFEVIGNIHDNPELLEVEVV